MANIKKIAPFLIAMSSMLFSLPAQLAAEESIAETLDSQVQLDQLLMMSRHSVMPTESTLGRIAPRVVGGNVSTNGEQRWITSLQFQDQHFCGAALIHPRWAVTAAHCVASLSARSLSVWVGGNDLRVESQGEREDVDRIILHPNYNPNNYTNDIALLRLDAPISSIAPVQVANAAIMTDQAAPGQPVSVSGWGRLSEAGGMPARLHDVSIPVVSRQECNSAAAYGGRVTSTMLCAGLRSGGKDACQGDSGGPLWLSVNGHDVLLGAVSWGTGCARPNKYGVYTRMVSYRNWIEQAAQITLPFNVPMNTPDPAEPDNCTPDSNGTPNGGTSAPQDTETLSYTFSPMQRDETEMLRLTIPEGLTEFVVETLGGSGDLDIYLSKDTRPTLQLYNYTSRTSDSTELIRIQSPVGGTWYLLAHAWSSTGSIELRLRMRR